MLREVHITRRPPPTGYRFTQKMAFGFGMATPIAFVNAVGQLTNLIFNIGLGVNPVLLGIAQTIPRFWDAVSDPLAGYISDNTRSRWGRRKPYIIVGGVAVADHVCPDLDRAKGTQRIPDLRLLPGHEPAVFHRGDGLLRAVGRARIRDERRLPRADAPVRLRQLHRQRLRDHSRPGCTNR